MVLKKCLRSILHSARPPICMDIASWANEHQLPLIEIHPPVLSEVEPHVWDDKAAVQDFQTHHAALARPQVLAAIDQATIRDTIGLVLLPDGQVCYEGNWFLPHLQHHPAYQRWFSRKTHYLKGDVYSLLGLWSQEFYHWFHDTLPRLEFALPYLPAGTKFLIHDQPRSYQLDSLQAYGITPDRLEVQPHNTDTKAERLWFANPIGHTGLGSGKALRVVADRLLGFFGVNSSGEPQSDKPLRIYVSRQDAKSRRVLNEKSLEPMLHDYGFSTYLCEELSLREQVRLFSRAEAIVGPHGAGLTNMIYAPAQTPVAEITPHPAVHYIVMARQLGHRFSRLDAIASEDNRSNDMLLDPQRLKAWLDSL